MKLILFLATLLSLKVLAQTTEVAPALESVASDVSRFLSEVSISEIQKNNCGEENSKTKTPEYDCGCEIESGSQATTVMVNGKNKKILVVPKKHKLSKEYGIKLLSIGTTFSAINDNTFLEFGQIVDGDDRGNTFGGNINLMSTLLDTKHDKKIHVGLNYSLRQYTLPLKGYSDLDSTNNQIDTWVLDENENYLLFNQRVVENLSDEYGDLTYLRNQASLSVQTLDVDMMIDSKKNLGPFLLSYGGTLGYKSLSDNADQLGALIQDDHHKNMGIYRFEWDSFSKLLIGGVEEYITIGPKVHLATPTLGRGLCRFKANTEFSVLFNTPVLNTSGGHSLNYVEPKMNAKVMLGLVPLKRDDTKSRFEFYANYNVDPNNRLPSNVDPGVKSHVMTGLKFNTNLGKWGQLHIIPVQFYIPIGKKDSDNILNPSGGVVVNDTKISERKLQNDVLGLWGEVGLVIKIGQNKK